MPIPSATDVMDEAKTVCHSCGESPPNYDTVIAMFRYQGVMADAIQHMKYRSRTSLIAPLSDLLCQHLDKVNPVDAVLAVPLHITRLRKREFNQSLSLAQPVAKKLGVPLLIDSLVRTRQTPPQTTLELKDRHSNVRNAFSARRRREIEDKALLLVDDVLTTGSTVNECAQTLRAAGARSIHVLALARTV